MSEQHCPCCNHPVKQVFTPGSGTGAVSHLEPDESERDNEIKRFAQMVAAYKKLLVAYRLDDHRLADQALRVLDKLEER